MNDRQYSGLILTIICYLLFSQNIFSQQTVDVEVVVKYGTDAIENSWEVINLQNGVSVLSGGPGANNSYSYNGIITLSPGNYRFIAYDQYGDGWNGGGFYSISPMFGTGTGIVYFPGGFEMQTNFSVYVNSSTDIGLVKWLEPLQEVYLTANEIVSLLVENSGQDTVSSFQLALSIDNGQNFVSEVFNDTILPDSIKEISFSQAFDFSLINEYQCITYVTNLSDSNFVNDTLYYSFQHYPVIDSFPYIETFNISPDNYWKTDQGDSSWKHSNSYMYCDFDNWTNSETAILETPPILINESSILSFDWSRHYYSSSDNSSFEIKVKAYDDLSWTTVFFKQGQDLFSNDGASSTSPGSFITDSVNLSNFVGETINIRFVGQSGWGPNLFLDKIEVNNFHYQDIEIVALSSVNQSCSFSNSEQMSFFIANLSPYISSVGHMYLSVDSGANYESFTINSIPALDTVVFQIPSFFDFSNPGFYSVEAYIVFPNDTNFTNDSLFIEIESQEKAEISGLYSVQDSFPIHIQVYYGNGLAYGNSWIVENENGDTIIYSPIGTPSSNIFSLDSVLNLPFGDYRFIARNVFGSGWTNSGDSSYYRISQISGIDDNKEFFFSGNVQVTDFRVGYPVIICREENGISIEGLPSGGTFNLAIQNSFIEIDSLSAGLHELTYTYVHQGSNCLTIDTQFFFIPYQEELINPDSIKICYNQEYNIEIQGDFDLVWSDGSTSNIYQVQNNGFHFVTATNSYLCSSTDSVFVEYYEIPGYNIPDSISICSNELYTIQADSNLQFYWDDGEYGTQRIFEETGNYHFSMHYDFACEIHDSIQVNVYNAPNNFLVDSVFSCISGISYIAPNHEFNSYLWSNGSVSDSIEIIQNGLVYLTVTDNNQCYGVDSSQLLFVDSPELNLDSVYEICLGDTLVLSPGNFHSYLWSTGAITNVSSFTEAAIYSLEVANVYGCTGSDSFLIHVHELPFVELGENISTCSNEAIDLNPGVFDSYLWNTGETSQIINVQMTGEYIVNVSDTNQCSNTDTISIEFLSSPLSFLDDSSFFCEGDIAIEFAGISDSYLWSDGNTSEVLISSLPGIYYVTMSNTTGCVLVDSIVLVEVQGANINLGNDTTLCSGTTLVLTPGLFSSYFWTNGSWNNYGSSIEVVLPGTYTLIVENNYGCESTDQITISYSDNPSYIFNDTSICSGESIQLLTNSTNSVIWNTGDTTNQITVSESGMYSFSIINEYGCVSSDSGNVIVFELPDINLGSDTNICGIASLILSPGLYEVYNWNNGSTQSHLNIQNSGNYSVTVSDSNSCINIDSIDVQFFPDPEVILYPDTFICEGDTIDIFYNTEYSFEWNDGSSVNEYSIFDQGVYFVKITDSNNCFVFDSINVVLNPSPQIDLGVDQNFCEGDSALLSVGQWDEIYWSSGETTSTIYVSQTGSYSVSVSNSYNCMSIDEINVNIHPNPTINIPVDTGFCIGGNLSLSLPPGYLYFWSTGNFSNQINIIQGGNYSVTAVDVIGCNSSVNFSVTESDIPVISLGNDTTICSNESVTLSPGNFYNYIWNTGETGSEILVNTEQIYSVTITNNYGCHSFDSIEISKFPEIETGVIADTSLSILDSIFIGVNNGFSSVTWNTGALSDSIIIIANNYNLGTNSFWVQVFDSNNCSVIDTFSIDIFEPIENQIINLYPTWNIFSTYIIPQNPDIEQVLLSIASDIVLVKNEDGLIYWPVFGINTIGDMILGEAYYLKSISNVSLQISGIAVQPELSEVFLESGWNLLAYLRTSSAPIDSMLNSIESDIIIVKNQSGFIYWPAFGINTIFNMNPGEGYQVKCLNQTSFYYPSNLVLFKSSGIFEGNSDFSNSGSNMTIGITGVPSGIQQKDLKIVNEKGNELSFQMFNVNDFVAFTLWGDNSYTEEIEGLKKNEKFFILNQFSEKSIQIQDFLHSNEKFFYAENRILLLEYESISNENFKFEISPNPASETINISAKFPAYSSIEISIYSLQGKLIKRIFSEHSEQGNFEKIFNINYLLTGVYLVNFKVNGFSSSRLLKVYSQVY